MKKSEQAFTVKFNNWLKTSYKGTACFEIKDTRGREYLPFSEVKEHQIRALQVARHNTLVYKISDSAMGYKPFDVFCMTQMPAYIVIHYPNGFVLITIDIFVIESKKSKRRSLTWERAQSIAWKVIHSP